MLRRYTLMILGIMLIGWIGVISDAVGFSKLSRSPASHKHYASRDSRQAPQMPVLQSSYALVEDQETSEFLVQKNATAAEPLKAIWSR